MPQHATLTESCPAPPPGSRGIDEILAEARTRLRRLDPEQAHLACRGGAIMVDIRPAAQRAAHGTVPGALVIERNVLEWRLDPRCPARLPEAVDYDLPVLVICQEGYTSSLAAAWRIAGLPALGPTSTHRTPSFAPPVTAGRTPH
jgi:rhodanese-related sulfurtransferase